MSAGTPLASAKEIRDLIGGLVGRDVEVNTGAAMVDPFSGDGALVGIYVDDRNKLVGLVLFDVPLAAYLGASLGLLPVRIAQQHADAGVLSEALSENAGEILNVMSALFNAEGAPHVKLGSVLPPLASIPADVRQWVLTYVRRMDLDMDVPGYGPGQFSLLVI